MKKKKKKGPHSWVDVLYGLMEWKSQPQVLMFQKGRGNLAWRASENKITSQIRREVYRLMFRVDCSIELSSHCTLRLRSSRVGGFAWDLWQHLQNIHVTIIFIIFLIPYVLPNFVIIILNQINIFIFIVVKALHPLKSIGVVPRIAWKHS